MIQRSDAIPEGILTVKISLDGSRPLIWRRLAISCNATLHDLHDAIQCVMPWDNYHLHEFLVWNRHYGVPHPDYGDDMLDEHDVTLSDVFRPRVKRITYIYDFGDGWEHSVENEGAFSADPDVDYPVCLAGANACPPEDSGSLYGYYEKLRVLGDPDDPEHEEICEWMPEAFDPEAFSVKQANISLALGNFEQDDFNSIEQD